MQGKSVACTLLQLFNKVSIIVQVPTARVSGTSSSWAVAKNNSSVCSWETYYAEGGGIR